MQSSLEKTSFQRSIAKAAPYLLLLPALAGILILGVVNNGLVMLKVDDNMTNIVKGCIIIGSVVLDMRKNAKKK